MSRKSIPLLVLVALLLPRPAPAYPRDVPFIRTAEEADAWLNLYGSSSAADPGGIQAVVRMRRLALIMEQHWRQLDAACDPAAVFALTYLITTRGIARHVEAGYFDDGITESVIMVSFAALYFKAYEDFASGHLERVSRPWYEAFTAGASGYTSVLEDVFLGMNAHVNYNLGPVMAYVGLVDDQGRSRKPDHDRINHVLADVLEEIAAALARYYDPTMSPEYGANPLVEPMVLRMIYAWRENAWRNAEVTAALPDQESRDMHDTYMQETAYAMAKTMQSPKTGPTRPARLAYCVANP